MKTKLTAAIICLSALAFDASAQYSWKPDPNFSYRIPETVIEAVSRTETFFGADLKYENESASIVTMVPHSPAHNYRFKTGDLIHSIGSVKITSDEAYRKALESFKVNEVVTIEYTRNGNRKERRVRLEEITVIKEAGSE